ncbi:MAG TPA: ABC transporter permease [Candidatus Saccharibacteria bacterium]|nr:ABC transporter permease [Candidatus Saccharibacteria bacterium]
MKHIYSKQNRALLAELVRTDFKLRYQGSVLGYAWSLLRPLFIFLILYIVFVKFLRLGGNIPHYPIYLLLGIVMWNFFTEITSQGLGSIVGRGDLIRKIKIPRWIIVLSSSISGLINVGLNLLVVLIFMLINQVDLLSTSVLFPLTLLQLYIFSLGVALLLSTAFVKYRDVSYIWEVLLQAGFYATPILYPLSLITNVTVQKVMLLNPVAQTVQDARYELVTHDTLTVWKVFEGGPYALIPVAITFATFILGVWYFKKESKYFAENI